MLVPTRRRGAPSVHVAKMVGAISNTGSFSFRMRENVGREEMSVIQRAVDNYRYRSEVETLVNK